MKDKQTKQKEAEARNKAYSKLSSEEKIERLDRASLRAERERVRIARKGF